MRIPVNIPRHRHAVASDPENFAMDIKETRWYCVPPPHGSYYVAMEGSYQVYKDAGRRGKQIMRIDRWGTPTASVYDSNWSRTNYYSVSFRP